VAEAAYRFNRRFRLLEMLLRLARAMELCKPWPEPNLRAVDNFHGLASSLIRTTEDETRFACHCTRDGLNKPSSNGLPNDFLRSGAKTSKFGRNVPL